MKHIVKTEEDWLGLRKKYITASEAAVLVGADPYSSPGKIRKPSTFTGNAYTDVGHLLEPEVVKQTNKALGMNFELYETADGTKEFYTVGNLGATPDAHQGREMLLECKTVNARTYPKYSAVPPNKYILQLIVQKICTEMKEGYLSMINTGLTGLIQYEKYLINPVIKKKYELSVFKLLNVDELSSILKIEAKRFTENEKFRVNSKIKQRVKLLLPLSYERII